MGETMKKREMNFELLRIFAMGMIIGLHYLDKGNVLGDFMEIKGINGHLAWIYEAFFFCSVNVYVLISGYFLIEKETTFRKVKAIWGQVIFYSLFLGILAVCTQTTGLEEIDIYRGAYYLFPVLTEHYWFVTDYVFLYLLLPVMNPVLSAMEQKRMRNLLFVFIGIFSMAKSVLPLSFAVDKRGYDILWFLCLYMTGAYCRRFGFPFLSTKARGFGLYFISSAAIFSGTLLLKEICLRTGHFKDIVTYAYSYNHILCYLAAVGLLAAFSHIKISSERAGKIIGLLSGASFGVYLIHEHIDWRYVWPKWLLTQKQAQSPAFVLLMPGSILAVYFVCAGIELLRQQLFLKVGGRLRYGKKQVVK